MASFPIHYFRVRNFILCKTKKGILKKKMFKEPVVNQNIHEESSLCFFFVFCFYKTNEEVGSIL